MADSLQCAVFSKIEQTVDARVQTDASRIVVRGSKSAERSAVHLFDLFGPDRVAFLVEHIDGVAVFVYGIHQFLGALGKDPVHAV